jgi:hypothetical protein
MLVTAWFFGDLKSFQSGPNITEDWRFLNNLFFFQLVGADCILQF